MTAAQTIRPSGPLRAAFDISHNDARLGVVLADFHISEFFQFPQFLG